MWSCVAFSGEDFTFGVISSCVATHGSPSFWAIALLAAMAVAGMIMLGRSGQFDVWDH